MLCYNFVQRTAETRFRRTWLIPSAQFCLPYVPILLRLFYTHTSYISSKFHSYNYGWKIQSIAMEILVRSQRARGTAKQPCCSDITHLTSSALLLRYLGRLKKSLWADAALQPIIKIAQPVALLRHFQKKKKKITQSLLKIHIQTMICDASWGPDSPQTEEGQLDQDVPETAHLVWPPPLPPCSWAKTALHMPQSKFRAWITPGIISVTWGILWGRL